MLPAVVALVAALLATGAAAAPSTPAWSSLKPGATTGWLTMEDAPHFVEPKTQALAAGTNRSFIVAGQGDVFLKDGQPFRFIAGTCAPQAPLPASAAACTQLKRFIMTARPQLTCGCALAASTTSVSTPRTGRTASCA